MRLEKLAAVAVLVSALAADAMVKPLSEPWLKAGETLVCFGDSITASKAQYMKYLTERLEAKGVKVINGGLGGDKTPMALTRIRDIAAMNPDAVMFFFGANDSVIGRGRWRDEPIVDPITFRDNLVWMIHYFRLRTKVSKFSIVAPTGRCEGDAYGEFGDICPKYGLAAREACDLTGAVLVPLDTAFDYEHRRVNADPSEFLLTRDGVHFSPRGSELAADVMMRSWKMDRPDAVEAEDPVPRKVTRRICLLENGDIGKYWYTWLKKVQKRGEDPDRVFTAEGTTLRVSGADMGCVTTRDAYRDYRLTLEFRYVDNDVQLNKTAARDGGILFHSTGRDGACGNGIWMNSFEYNVIQGAAGDLIVVGSRKVCPGVYRCKGRVDPATRGKSSQHWDPNGPEIDLVDSGRIRRPDVDLEWKNLKTQALSPNENPIGEWNTAEVVCRGDTAEFYFNGMKTGEYRDMHPAAGRIQLQSEGFGIEYRNIVLSPLD